MLRCTINLGRQTARRNIDSQAFFAAEVFAPRRSCQTPTHFDTGAPDSCQRAERVTLGTSSPHVMARLDRAIGSGTAIGQEGLHAAGQAHAREEIRPRLARSGEYPDAERTSRCVRYQVAPATTALPPTEALSYTLPARGAP